MAQREPQLSFGTFCLPDPWLRPLRETSMEHRQPAFLELRLHARARIAIL